MAWAKGNKFGKGRRKGSKNTRTSNMVKELSEKYPGWDPVIAMAAIAQDSEVEMALRIQCLKDVAGFIYAKKKAVEVTGDIHHITHESTVDESIAYLSAAGIDISDLEGPLESEVVQLPVRVNDS